MKSSLRWKKVVRKRNNFLIPEGEIKSEFLVEICGYMYRVKATFIYQATKERCFRCGASQGFFTCNQKKILTRVSGKIFSVGTGKFLDVYSAAGKTIIKKLSATLKRPFCESCLMNLQIDGVALNLLKLNL